MTQLRASMVLAALMASLDQSVIVQLDTQVE